MLSLKKDLLVLQKILIGVMSQTHFHSVKPQRSSKCKLISNLMSSLLTFSNPQGSHGDSVLSSSRFSQHTDYAQCVFPHAKPYSGKHLTDIWSEKGKFGLAMNTWSLSMLGNDALQRRKKFKAKRPGKYRMIKFL